AAPDPCHILEAHLTSNNAALKAAIVEAAVASVQAKEVLLLGVVCPPVQSEFLSIVASLVPFSFGLKERSTRWVSSLRMKPETTEPLVNTMGHIMSATLELAALVEGGEREKATTRLLELIEDLDYEVRALAIKFALKALQSDTSLLFDWQRVQGTLLQRLHTESHHTCIKHLLALLFVFPVPLPDSVLLGDAAVGSALDTQTFFAHLRGLLDRWPNGATRENIVSHMGVYLSQLLGRAEEAREKLGAGALRDMLSVWSGIIQQAVLGARDGVDLPPGGGPLHPRLGHLRLQARHVGGSLVRTRADFADRAGDRCAPARRRRRHRARRG
ncbi:uncharacterized protein ACA1_295040, partial [Acanthamoeba castellanii str. Neff]